MALHRDFESAFEPRLRAVTGAGIELPSDVAAVRDRVKAFRPSGNVMINRLAQAVIDGDTDADTDLLWALALAESMSDSPVGREVFESVQAKMNAGVRAAFRPYAGGHFRAVAALFDQAATAFAAATAACDPEIPAELVVTASEKVRRAWTDAEVHATTMTKLVPALRSAAALAGIISDDDHDHDLPLCVDTAGLHRRELWHAWDCDEREAVAQSRSAGDPFTRAEVPITRTKRWGALTRLGAVLRAHDADAPFEDYRRPQPMIERMVDGKRIQVDPEDPDYEEPQPTKFEPPLTRSARITVNR